MQTQASVTPRLDGVCGGSKDTNPTDPIIYIPCNSVLTLSHSHQQDYKLHVSLQTAARFGSAVPSSGSFKFRAVQAPKNRSGEYNANVSHHGVPGHSGLFGRRGRYTCDYKRLFQGFRFSSSLPAAYETGGLGRGFEASPLCKGIPCRSYT
jgi:hypothetical protein